MNADSRPTLPGLIMKMRREGSPGFVLANNMSFALVFLPPSATGRAVPEVGVRRTADSRGGGQVGPPGQDAPAALLASLAHPVGHLQPFLPAVVPGHHNRTHPEWRDPVIPGTMPVPARTSPPCTAFCS